VESLLIISASTAVENILLNCNALISLTKVKNMEILSTRARIAGVRIKNTYIEEVPLMALTKADLIDHIHSQLKIPRKRSSELLESFFEITKDTLSKGEDVLISGFGKFCVKDKKSRKGRNPQTGRDLTLGQRRVVTFKCSSSLKSKLNGEN
jgi:integration host factor subunit alpha